MAEITQIIWDDEPGGNVEHIAEHGVTPDEVVAVLDARRRSKTHPGRWVVDGYTAAGRKLRVVFEYIEALDLVIPVTAFEPAKKEN